MRALWITAGLVSAGIGIVALFVPLLPSTVFLLFASFAFARSSERLHGWLMEHPRLGPPIVNWQTERAVERGTKWMATVSIVGAVVFSWAIGLAAWILLAQVLTLSGVIAYIWSRPEPRHQAA